MEVALQFLNASVFQSLLGQDFLFHFSSEVTGVAQLQEVVALPNHHHYSRPPFSITLQTAETSREYQQGIYTIQHDAVGSIQLFLVPVGCNEKGLQYEAVFS